jgi:hypothetical protein
MTIHIVDEQLILFLKECLNENEKNIVHFGEIPVLEGYFDLIKIENHYLFKKIWVSKM